MKLSIGGSKICFALFNCLFLDTLQGEGCNLFLYICIKAEKNWPEEFYKNVENELKIIFSTIASSKTATFLELRYLFLYRYFFKILPKFLWPS